MAKVADQYFQIHPWEIVEEGVNPQYAKVAESVFSIGNEYMGVRGYFEEGYAGESLIGSYFNGIYEREILGSGGYKGIINETEFMVNAVNYLAAQIRMDGEKLEIGQSDIFDFRRVLDMKNGLLTRSFCWKTKNGKTVKVIFERLLSMECANMGAQKISIQSVDFDGKVQVALESDFGVVHQMHQKNYWRVTQQEATPDWISIEARTIHTNQYLFSGSSIYCSGQGEARSYKADQKVGAEYIRSIKKGESVTLTRIFWNDKEEREEYKSRIEGIRFSELLEKNKEWWGKVWEKSDIIICGDDENQQGIRYCIFQMMQTYHGAKAGNNIGAKGLTGEAYNGNAFWDTETYCLPFFLFNNRKAAKNLLLFRYQTLAEAKKRAKDLDCKGAFYPIATISGRECCNLWQHASLQLQASTAVAYGVWLYENQTKDIPFLRDYGAEMLVEICRMLASRGDWSADGTNYGYYCVMGPDEFQMMVNHNCYTNVMARFTFTYTRKVLDTLSKEDEAQYQNLEKKLGLQKEEIDDWENKAEHMKILYDKKSRLFEQHDGFFKLPHVEVDEIPVEEFPLYHHWSYDRIYRNDMIKQPDVLMFMLLFNQSFTEEQLRANYEYYEPKCIHESSLSPSVHSILASQLKKKEEAFEFFGFATRMDLDNYNRNTEEGLHTTSIAAAWMNIIYGFGGMRSDGDILALSPTIPDNWDGYTFHVNVGEGTMTVAVSREKVRLDWNGEHTCKVLVYGKEYQLGEETIWVTISKDWR